MDTVIMLPLLTDDTSQTLTLFVNPNLLAVKDHRPSS